MTMSLAEQMFAEMANAPMFGSGQWFHEGKYLVGIKLLKKNEGFNGNFFVAEFDVLTSTNQEEDPVGSTRSYLINLDTKKNKNAYGDAKKVAFAILGIDPETVPNDPKAGGVITVTLGGQLVQVTPAQAHTEAARLVAAILNPEFAAANGIRVEAFYGIQLALETWGKPKKSKPDENFTVHKWKPLACLTPEQKAMIGVTQ